MQRPDAYIRVSLSPEMSPPQPGPAGTKKSISPCVMRFVLVARPFPHIFQAFLAAPFRISPVRDYASPGHRPGKGAPSESRSIAPYRGPVVVRFFQYTWRSNAFSTSPIRHPLISGGRGRRVGQV